MVLTYRIVHIRSYSANSKTPKYSYPELLLAQDTWPPKTLAVAALTTFCCSSARYWVTLLTSGGHWGT